VSLDDLKSQGLLLPRRHWGRTPPVSWRSRLQLILCGGLFLLSALLVWFGAGGVVTFAGIALFLAVLFLFVFLTFKAVDFQVAHLLDLGVGGEVEGLAEPGEGEEEEDEQ